MFRRASEPESRRRSSHAIRSRRFLCLRGSVLWRSSNRTNLVVEPNRGRRRNDGGKRRFGLTVQGQVRRLGNRGDGAEPPPPRCDRQRHTLGRFTVTADWTLAPTGNSGTTTWTAANGDELFTSFTRSGVPMRFIASSRATRSAPGSPLTRTASSSETCCTPRPRLRLWRRACSTRIRRISWAETAKQWARFCHCIRL